MRNTSCKTKIFCTVLSLIVLLSSFSGIVFAEGSNGKIMVSMGDSYSSGEGIEPFYGQEYPLTVKIKDPDWLAHRSTLSWSGQLVLDGKTMKDYKDINWFFVASSGATTEHINGQQEKNADKSQGKGVKRSGRAVAYKSDEKKSDYTSHIKLEPQIKVISEKNLKDKVDYITLTIGGNDAEFAKILEEGVLEHHFSTGNVADKLNEVWDNFYKENGIRDNIRKSYNDIVNAAGSQAKIIVAGYPKLLDSKEASGAIREDSANLINESVSRFNKELESIVNSCKADGTKICFVSVEDEFDGHGAYAEDSYINDIIMGTKSEDLTGGLFSAYSIHPNAKGAAAYARCVQKKIDDIEKDGGKSEWPKMSGSEMQDVALVLDTSGSMNGTPIEETKKAAMRFTNTTLHEDVGIGMIIYDSSAQTVSGFNKNEEYLDNIIQNINSGGGTNIESGLIKARELFEHSNAKKKYIILMSDGEPNAGKTGNALVEYADSLKKEGFRIYTLGFFSSVASKTAPQELMERIANDGCHYEVDDASQLVFFFNDIAEQMRGTKYYYIRIACPVDVTVSCDGETLSSKGADKNQRTSFGTMSFEDNAVKSDSSDNRIKTLRLKEGVNYDIQIEGNGEGSMSYTIGFMDEDGEYTDLRNFNDINITQNTKIDTMAAYSDATTMKVDENGDGKYDYIYKAEQNSNGLIYNYKPMLKLLLMPVWILLLILMIIIIVKIIKNKKKEGQSNE